MTQQTAAAEEVARRLLAHVGGTTQSSEELADAAEAAHRRLRERLVLVLGPAGFDALWARALLQVQRQAGRRDPNVRASEPASAARPLHALVREQYADEARERLIDVFGACIGLLYTFIGRDLSFRLVQQTWPDVPLDQAAVGKEGEEATS